MSVEVWDHDELLGLASERIVEYIDNLEARIERADAVIRDTAAYEGSQQARIEALEARVNLSARHPTDQFIEGVMMRDTKILEQVERIETLMRGLKCYGVHGHYCGYVTDANEPNGSPDIVGKCTCGLDALRDDSGGKLPWETTEACADALREQLAARAEDAERITVLEEALRKVQLIANNPISTNDSTEIAMVCHVALDSHDATKEDPDGQGDR